MGMGMCTDPACQIGFTPHMARVGDVPEDQTATAKVLEIFKDIHETIGKPYQTISVERRKADMLAAALLTLATVLSEKG